MTVIKDWPSSSVEVRAPEATIFIHVIWSDPIRVQLNAGKSGTAANSLALALGEIISYTLTAMLTTSAWMGRSLSDEARYLAQTSCLGDIARTLEGITHDRADPNRWEAKSMGDAVAIGLRRILEDERSRS